MGKKQQMCRYEPGERYGKLVIVREISKEERKDKWKPELLCICDCGKFTRVQPNNLMNTKSCGCLRKERYEHQTDIYKYDLIGKRFGRLVVKSDVPKSEWKNKKKREFYCVCDCGNITKVRRNGLVSGNTRSCGCLKNEYRSNQFEDISGQVFGELTAIKRVDSYINKSGARLTKWLFRCSCGREVELCINNIKTGGSKSCGHTGKSFAEYEIIKWLTDNNISFDAQSTFHDLKNPDTGRNLRYDFKIYRSDGSFFIVEHHGMQHFREKAGEFGRLQRELTDRIKRDYCKKNGITLYETVYDEDYMSKLKDIIRKENESGGVAYEREVIDA